MPHLAPVLPRSWTGASSPSFNCFWDGGGGIPWEIDQAKSPLGQRFDRELCPISGEIDNSEIDLF